MYKGVECEWGLNHGLIGSSNLLPGIAVRGKLAAIGSIRHHREGDGLFHEGSEASCILYIDSGVVKVINSLPGGKEIVQGFLFPGDLAGFGEYGGYAATVKAITPVAAVHLRAAAVEALLRSDPDLQSQIFFKLCQNLRLAQQHVVSLVQPSAKKRIVMLLNLLRIHSQFTRQLPEQIHLPMSRTDIADYTGLAVETVSRNFQRLQREGTIRLITSHCVEITDERVFESLLRTED